MTLHPTLTTAQEFARKAQERQAQAAVAVRDRDHWVRAAHEEGLSLRTIAEAVGLTHAGVAKIVQEGGVMSNMGAQVLVLWPHPWAGRRGEVVGVRPTGVLTVHLRSGGTTEVRPSLVRPDPYR